MTPIISFDMDGTLVESEYTDWVWNHGIPNLYAKKAGLSFEEAKAFVEGEYRKVGDGAPEWYDIQYWFRFFQLQTGWRALMEQYVDKIGVYPDVSHLLDRLKGRFKLVLTSNAGREFIEVEMGATGLDRYFDRIFSATSDFREVKKTPVSISVSARFSRFLPETWFTWETTLNSIIAFRGRWGSGPSISTGRLSRMGNLSSGI